MYRKHQGPEKSLTIFNEVWFGLKVLKLPIGIIWDRVLSPPVRGCRQALRWVMERGQRNQRHQQLQPPPFSQRVTLFEDVVVRCIQYAFANVPPRIGRVFFAREVALPYLWFRLMRKGYFGSPIYWREHCDVGAIHGSDQLGAWSECERFRANRGDSRVSGEFGCVRIL